MNDLFEQNDAPGTESGIQERMARLSALLRRYDRAYYIDGTSEVSDREYDALFDELKTLEEAHPNFADENSPVRRVGSDLSSDFPEVRHSIPVLSLDKAYNIEEIRQWIVRCSKQAGRNFQIVVEEKMDGASLVIYYRDGRFERAVTRGNGETGNDISDNVKTIRSVPLQLAEPVTAAIRGEVYMTKSDFEAVRKSAEVEYANPRNFAAGSLRRIKSSQVAKVPLRFFAYEPGGESFSDSHTRNLEMLEQLGFSVNSRMTGFPVSTESDESLQSCLDDISGHIEKATAERAGLDYEIDGLVLKIDEMAIRDELGSTGHHPRWAIAYKFESPQGRTVVRDIDIQIGRTGRATPVARVEPVAVGGTTIRNVTLHNQDYIDSLGLSIGDEVAVSRRGDVIPAIEQVLEKGEEAVPWHMPHDCPSCGTALEKDGAHHFCTNFACPERQKWRLIFFTGRDQMDIDNLGQETIAQLLEKGMIHDIPDLFTLNYDEIAAMEGFAEKKAALIKQGIEEAKKQPYRRILVSLGLNDLGPRMAELLEENGYLSIDDLFSLVDEERDGELLEIKGIGDKTIESVCRQLREPRFREMVQRLKVLGLNFTADPPAEKNGEGVFSGQTWCATGTFENFKPRSKAMELVKEGGGDVVSDVTSRTTHLLAGASAGSKLNKAQKLGVTVVSEEEFLQLIG